MALSYLVDTSVLERLVHANVREVAGPLANNCSTYYGQFGYPALTSMGFLIEVYEGLTAQTDPLLATKACPATSPNGASANLGT